MWYDCFVYRDRSRYCHINVKKSLFPFLHVNVSPSDVNTNFCHFCQADQEYKQTNNLLQGKRQVKIRAMFREHLHLWWFGHVRKSSTQFKFDLLHLKLNCMIMFGCISGHALQTLSYGLHSRCHLLCCELMCAHRDAVDKLHGTPQAVKLHALVNVHDTVGGRRPTPHPIVQETADARQNDLKHGKAAAKTLFGQQVPLTRNGNLLPEKRMDARLYYWRYHLDCQFILSCFVFLPVSHSISRVVLDSPAGFPTSRLEARGAEGRTLLPAFSSSPQASHPLCNTQTKSGSCALSTELKHKSLTTSPFTGNSVSMACPSPFLDTFDVNSGQDVLEGGGMKQVTHFLLRLKGQAQQKKGSFQVKERQPFRFIDTLTAHAGSHEVMLTLYVSDWMRLKQSYGLGM